MNFKSKVVWIASMVIMFTLLLVLNAERLNVATPFLSGKEEIKVFSINKNLETIQSEAELKRYFKKVRKNSERVGIYQTLGAEEDAASSKTGEHSETNNQVSGVEEGDIVQTNGNVIFHISNNEVFITDVSNPSNMKKLSILPSETDFYPTQLFLKDDLLIVLGMESFPTIYPEGKTMTRDTMMWMGGFTSAHVYDVKNADRPKLLREFGTEGNFTGARLTNGTLYFITTVYPNFMSTMEDTSLIPKIYDSNKDENMTNLPLNKISILPGTLEGSYSIITTIDLTNVTENKVETNAYLGGGQSLYMSKENLYLTTAYYEENKVDTEIFKFQLDGTKVNFIASTRIPGTLLNQFSMDEYENYFRVVTTEGNSWGENGESKNSLLILNENLQKVSSIEGLAKGERIYSARFLGNRAYMVTFRQTDPLFVFDVENPENPKILGELKIPGFSNYLHPLDETHLIGFGYDTKLEYIQGQKEPVVVTGGMKISLFDVSDFANPKEQDTEIIGGQGTYSALQYDHKALFKYESRDLYGFPVTIYKGNGPQSAPNLVAEGALLYKITSENGIEEAASLLRLPRDGQYYEDWDRAIFRIVYSGDAIYTISMRDVTSYNINSFEQLDVLDFR